VPTEGPWFEFRAEPLVQLSTSHYWIETVYRDHDRKPVQEFMNSYFEHIGNALMIIEQE
jgi:hypothetical protein